MLLGLRHSCIRYRQHILGLQYEVVFVLVAEHVNLQEMRCQLHITAVLVADLCTLWVILSMYCCFTVSQHSFRAPRPFLAKGWGSKSGQLLSDIDVNKDK